MTHGFYIYRVFISGPGDLERDREACRAAISEVNEKQAMPARILLASVGLLEDEHIVGYRAAVADNVRAATYFIQIFEDDWGPKNLFRKIFLLALECRDNEDMPMHEVVVCIKDAPGESDPEILQFRRELEESPGVRLARYRTVAELKEKLVEICGAWVGELRESTAGAAAGSEAD